MNLQELPEKVKDRAEEIKEDSDVDKSTAIAIARDQLDMSAGEAVELEDGPCESGYVMVGTKTQDGQEVPNCVPQESTGELEPPNLSKHVLASNRTLSDEIKRVEESDNTVRYENISLLSEGVWTDQASGVPTLYSADAFDNIEAEFDESEFDGPPVNEMHDVDTETGEVNETSLAGYVDPDSLHVVGKTLRGDIVLEADKTAGEIADERMQDSLESGGRVGYGGPSVELDLDPQEDIELSDHPRAEKEINGAKLTGLGLVSNQADRNIGFGKEAQDRAVALSSGEDALMLEKEQRNMADAEELRETLESAGIDTSDMEDEDVMDMAESLHGDLMEELEMAEDEEEDEGEEEKDMAEHEDEEDEEEEEKEMMDDEAREVMQDMINEEMDDLWGELDEIKEQINEMGAEMASESELSDAREELAEADTVEEIEKTLSEVTDTVEKIAEEPNNEDRTLAEGTDWEPEYDDTGVSHSPSW